uniref:RING-type E3 ubiquitin transferase n=1 Tax=Kwoniella pini CBS 10737 TaxID=1296096 RepID=A0A1B9I4I4_9TREE|nr:uncharacterized protein I206_03749 [Kwoniella pini CBS 10737]OCF50427.1 hypothetical protein I206_03749 [Kwoniella pini CBS 10737]
MSRRGFDTSLSNSKSTTKPNKPNRKNSATIPTPDPEHAISHVPTHTTSERAALDRKNSSKDVVVKDETPEEVDDDVCFICAEPITFWSVGICGHRTCHVCAVRLRTFYKKTDCTFCKTPLPSLLFSRSPSTPFPSEHHITPSPPNVIADAQAKIESLPKGKKWDEGITHPGSLDVAAFPYGDDILSVVFEDEDMMDATLLLLRFNCPYQDCPYQGTNWQSLEKHTLATHGLMICTLCRSTLSRFAHEQGLYPPHLISLHDPSKLKRGQRPPRPRGSEIELVKSWDAPHPLCEFCHQSFFGPDELFKHMRADHEECHVCRGLGDKDVYFQNYNALEKHFNQDHFPCQQPICLEKKFVVFGTEMDLKAHTITEHSESMSSRDKAQSRQIAVDFSSDRRPGNRQQGSRGFTLAQPFDPSQRQLNKDRQEENRRRKAFATGLTREDGSSGSRVTQQAEESANPAAYASTSRDDVDEIVATRHAELLSRVSMLVSDSPTKLSSFRSAVRSYKNNESAAKDMVDTIFHVFDRDLDTTTGVVREISSLFSTDADGEKERNVLEALNAFRIEQQEQFPSLGNVTPRGLGSNYAGITSGKILNAKKTTGRSGGTVWSRVEAAAASHPVNRPTPTTGLNGRFVPGSSARVPISSTSAFPSLSGPGPGSGSGTSSSSKANASTPWAGGSGGGTGNKTPSALAGPQIRSVNFPITSNSSKSKPLNNSAFPSLPTTSNKGLSSIEKKALFSKPTNRDESLKRITGNITPPTNGWGGGNGNNTPINLDNLDINENQLSTSSITDGNSSQNGNQGGGGKKKGKSKQLLFSVSARPSGGPSHG